MRFVISTRLCARVAAFGLLVLPGACSRGIPAAKTGVPARASSVPRNGLEVVGAMRAAHPSRELTSLAFTVRATEYRPDTTVELTSRVHAQLPGRYHVAELPVSRNSGYVRVRDRASEFRRGRRVEQHRGPDLSLLLAYDIYAQSLDTTVALLDATRVRVSLMRTDELDGRRMVVVGAAAGDSTSDQFWVDPDGWRVARVIYSDPLSGGRVVDVRFTADTIVHGVPVPTRALVHVGGRLVQRQVVERMVANPRISSRAFSLTRWQRLTN